MLNEKVFLMEKMFNNQFSMLNFHLSASNLSIEH